MEKPEIAMHLTLKAIEMDMIPRQRLDAGSTSEQAVENIAINAGLVAKFYREIIARLADC